MFERANPFHTAQIVSSAEPGDVVCVQRGDAGALRFDVEGGDVGEADDPFGLVAEARRPYAMGDSIEAIAASCGNHGACLTIRESLGQFREAARIRSGEETVSLEQPFPEHDFITIMEPAEPLQHERTVEWSRRGNHPNSVSWAKGGGNDGG